MDAVAFKHDVASIAEAPDTGVIGSDERVSFGSLNDELHMLRTWFHTLCHEHPVESVGVFITFHQAMHRVAGDVSAFSLFAQSPANLVAIALGDDAALARFCRTTTTDIPFPDIIEGRAALVAHFQVADGLPLQVLKHDVAFSTFSSDVHQARFRDTCITIVIQHHMNVEVVELRTRKNCDDRQEKNDDYREESP